MAKYTCSDSTVGRVNLCVNDHGYHFQERGRIYQKKWSIQKSPWDSICSKDCA